MGLGLGKEIKLDYSGLKEGHDKVFSDKQRIQQVCLNLLSNAVKFSKLPTIRVKVDQVGSYLRCSVKNVGVPISQNDIETRLFKPFTTLSGGKTVNPNGTGLGLYICKEITEMLGGELTCTTEPKLLKLEE